MTDKLTYLLRSNEYVPGEEMQDDFPSRMPPPRMSPPRMSPPRMSPPRMPPPRMPDMVQEREFPSRLPIPSQAKDATNHQSKYNPTR